MAGELVRSLSSARIQAYEADVVARSGRAIAEVGRGEIESLYIWQVSVAAAWYETIALFEPLMRNRIDVSLRKWNTDNGRTIDWLEDAATPLRGLVGRMAQDGRRAAEKAARRRAPIHPRFRAQVNFDDRISQLTFGNLSALFPQKVPAHRGNLASGFTAHENLWRFALRKAFPGLSPKFVENAKYAYGFTVPEEVEAAYAVGCSLDALRKLRNRVSHQEQILYVDHAARLSEIYGLTLAMAPQSLGMMKRLDRVQRTLALKPQY